jgi:hypothetical protein
MREMWCHQVEGDALRDLVIKTDRVLVSTGKETLAVSLQGAVLGRRERRETDRTPGVPLTRVGEFWYALERRELVRFAADGTLVSRTPIRLDLFARELRRAFAHPTDNQLNAMIDAKISNWDRSVYLRADSARKRLLAIGQSIPPWLAAIRTDGAIDWVLIAGKITGCCNWAGVVSRDGTLVHVSSCGQRVTFISAAGAILSAHDVEGFPGVLSTEGRDIAYVTFPDEGIAAYRPNAGHVGSVSIPGVIVAQVRDGVFYCVTKDPVAGIVLKAFEEPSFG